MKLVKMTCPQCGANLEVDRDRKTMFCQYCGAKLALDDEEIKVRYTSVDEARIREAEAAERLRLKELEIEQEQKRMKLLTTAAIPAVALIMIVVGFIIYTVNSSSSKGLLMLEFGALILLYYGMFHFKKE